MLSDYLVPSAHRSINVDTFESPSYKRFGGPVRKGKIFRFYRGNGVWSCESINYKIKIIFIKNT
jgi:hypothetical protein